MACFRSWAEIDLDALRDNLALIRSMLAPATRLCLMVKADAYGHGARSLLSSQTELGADVLGVADLGEALRLRALRHAGKILVTGPLLRGEEEAAVAADLEVTVHDLPTIERLECAALPGRRKVAVHVHADAGFGRYGLGDEDFVAAARAVRSSMSLRLAGLSTHLATASLGRDRQADLVMERFGRLVRRCLRRETAGTAPSAGGTGSETLPVVHAANSLGVLSGRAAAMGGVRVGLAAYGLVPAIWPRAGGFRPVLSFRSRLLAVRWIPRGSAVGYGAHFRARRRTRLGLMAAGYHDGIDYRGGLHGGLCVLVRGRKVPVIGSVSMDSTALDLTAQPSVEAGEIATVYGSDGDERITIPEVADALATIPYQLACRIGQRVERIVSVARTAASAVRVRAPGRSAGRAAADLPPGAPHSAP